MPLLHQNLRLLPVGILLLFLSGCLSIQSLQSADPHILHHHNWWNYYERGRLYLREGNVEAAAADFQTAMGLRPGARYAYAEDRWRVRTYGMHMMEGYFPNRELGICLLEMDQLQEALDRLETSIEMEPSARAKFYLNIARRELADAAQPPQIQLNPQPQWTDRHTILLAGTVRGNYVAQIQINGMPEFIELAEKEISFEQELSLTEGRNEITIEAEDISGRTVSTNILVQADWQTPKISLQEAEKSGRNIRFTLQFQDNFSLEQLEINGQRLTPPDKQYTHTGTVRTGEPLTLSATDRAGNRLDWTLETAHLQQLALKKQDVSPPHLHLEHAGKTITLYNSRYALDIRAQDDTALQTVQLNGKPLLSEPAPTFRTLRSIPLDIGTNRLSLVAEDISEKRTEQQITIIRRKPEYLDRHYRLTAETSPVSGELPDETFGRRTDLLFGQEITRDPVRFYLLAAEEERTGILKEQTLSATDLADTRAALAFDKTLESDLKLVTRVLSDGEGQTIYTQIKDARNGDELFIEDVYIENSKQLRRQISGLVMKIEQDFPLIQARLTEKDKALSIDVGSGQGVQEGTRFLVIHTDGTFEEGQVLKDENRPVELVISEVEPRSANGILIPGSAKRSVQPGDYVFTR